MTSSPSPTGRRTTRGDAACVTYERAFTAPIDSVWAAVTEPERLARWIGTWSGEPASGSVDFRMTAEGEECPVEVYRIIECDPPRRLVTESGGADGGMVWHVELDLTEADGITTLVFAQRLDDPELAASVGPGWDYYLDRLVAAETGGDVAAVSFDDYYPAQSEHYRRELS